MAGSRKSIIVLSSTGVNLNTTGEKIRAGGYFGLSDGMHTVQITYHNFTGGVGIQGTLSLNPTENDWFWINLDGDTNFHAEPYINFPLDPLKPTGSPNNNASHIGDTGTKAYTFKGNFTYLRGVVTRDHLPPATDTTWEFGYIDKITLCL